MVGDAACNQSRYVSGACVYVRDARDARAYDLYSMNHVCIYTYATRWVRDRDQKFVSSKTRDIMFDVQPTVNCIILNFSYVEKDSQLY